MMAAKQCDFFEQERKLTFISTLSDSIKPRAKDAFMLSARFERKYNVDLTNFSTNQVVDFMVSQLSTFVKSTCQLYVTIYRNYIKWCAENGFIDKRVVLSHDLMRDIRINWISGRDVGTLQKFVDNVVAKEDIDFEISPDADFSFISEEQFFHYLRTLCSNDSFIMLGASLTLIYYGIPRDDVINVKKSDLDEQQKTICGIKYENADADYLLTRAKHLDFYIVENDEYDTKYPVYLDDSDNLIRVRKPSAEVSDVRVTISYVKRLRTLEDTAANNLPSYSPYKDVRIASKSISKLRLFFAARDYEKVNGVEATIKALAKGHFKNGSVKINEFDYVFWKIRSKAFSKKLDV